MFKYILFFVLGVSIVQASSKTNVRKEVKIQSKTPVQNPDFDHSHKEFDRMLKIYVKNGRVNYQEWLKHDYQALVAHLSKVSLLSQKNLAAFTKDQRLAFLMNAYNAYTVKLILDFLPQKIKSIRDIGPKLAFLNRSKQWKVSEYRVNKKASPEKIIVAGENLSLDDIEHVKIRPVFKDPRIHFAVVCAARSCPILQNYVYTGIKLQKQLDLVTREFLQDKSRNKIGIKKAEISKLFDWYADDFIEHSGSVWAYLRSYLPKDFAKVKKPSISFMSYDWALND